MKKVISFSLYKSPDNWEKLMDTNNLKYVNGFLNIIKTIDEYFLDWTIYLYHDKNYNFDNIKEFLPQKNKIEFRLTDDYSINAMQWRFLPIEEVDVDVFISRDLDSRFSHRELVSIHEWLESDKIIHIMRDHPHHGYRILGGMWGMKKVENFNIKKEILNYNFSKNYDQKKDWYDKWWDMNFLRDVIYPNFYKSSYINADYHAFEPWSKPFTTQRDNGHFVGEIFNDKNERTDHYKLL